MDPPKNRGIIHAAKVCYFFFSNFFSPFFLNERVVFIIFFANYPILIDLLTSPSPSSLSSPLSSPLFSLLFPLPSSFPSHFPFSHFFSRVEMVLTEKTVPDVKNRVQFKFVNKSKMSNSLSDEDMLEVMLVLVAIPSLLREKMMEVLRLL